MTADWPPLPVVLDLTPGKVDVFRVPLEELLLSGSYALLSPGEILRARRFASLKKAREFIVTRGTLRKILGHALDENPRVFNIEYEERGRPYLAGAGSCSGVRFSVSHSHDLALIALTRSRRVGIDLERIRADIDHDDLSRRFFSSAEHAALQDQRDDTRLRAFYAVWTRKESLVKATGKGIAGGLKCFDVSADPDQPARLLATRWEAEESLPDWRLNDIPAGPAYLACVAVDGEASVRCWDASLV